MSRPTFADAISWEHFESSVQLVFSEALRRLAGRSKLPRSEEPTNLELFREAVRVHWEKSRDLGLEMLPFSIIFDAKNQPTSDDTVRSGRLQKRPDFICSLMDPQAPDVSLSQLAYYIECKRIGLAIGTWNLNRNYSDHGILRFVHEEWQYAKGCPSATMIGYLQSADFSTVLHEINNAANLNGFPSLVEPACGWIADEVHSPSQAPLVRTIDPNTFPLGHIWVDVRKCQLEDCPALLKPSSVPKKKTSSKHSKGKVAIAP